MRIGIYNESSAGMLGGSEYEAAVLAADLSRDHQVDLVHHHVGLTPDALERFTGFAIDGVNLRFVVRTTPAPSSTGAPWTIWRESTAWHADYSAPYDLFVCIGHWMPPFCRAKRGVLVALFPLFRPFEQWPFDDPPRTVLDLRRRLRQAYYRWEWRRRMGSYRDIVSISEFTRTWTRRFWGVDSSVVYPPVAVEEAPWPAAKGNTIVSVGRFAAGGHPKKHAELIRTFASMAGLRANGWRYELLGACGDHPGDRAYLAAIESLAGDSGAHVHVNVSRAELLQRYAAAKIFVHGAGYGEPDDKPERAEHFGIVTVEAMAAGCVPIVVNRGGQPEIVRHGIDGFVWNTLDELEQHIRLVASDESLRLRLSLAARERSRRFGKDAFVEGMRRFVTRGR